MDKHISHYVSLIGILVVSFIGFYMFSYDRFFLAGIAVALSVSYTAWGIIHHLVHKDICINIVLEYVSVAILGLAMILSLIFRN